jgi:hypothetical protein
VTEQDEKSSPKEGRVGAPSGQKTAPSEAKSATDKPRDDKIHCWPYLTRLEFLVAIAVVTVLVVWSILVDAPLEEIANPSITPNPSKAPWYFLGLQELLVYFDPWIAGVVVPTLIIIGLMIIPYIDFNPKGNGYYTFAERKFAVSTFIFGFIVLWVALIIVGVFFRGPGWNLFWPWEKWDAHKVVALANVDLPYWGPFGWIGERVPWLSNPKILGVEIIGFLAIFLWFSLGVLYYRKKKDSPIIRELGLLRYGIVAFLFLTMMAIPVKMLLRLLFNIKYIWVTPWFNV